MASTESELKYRHKVENAWCMYDWANSVYSLVIVSTIFPIYFSHTALGANGSEVINYFGFQINNGAAFSFTLSLAFTIVALLNPILTAIADGGGNKRSFLTFFCLLGAFHCSALFFFTEGMNAYGIYCFLMATIGYTGSLVFYNAYLTEITHENNYDKLSARGFMFGYIGSFLLQVATLIPILQPQLFNNISSGLASRIAFLATGLWWAGFGYFAAIRKLPLGIKSEAVKINPIHTGFNTLAKVYVELRHQIYLKRFLWAYLFFNMGVQTTMYLATIFADKVLHLPQGSLIATILGLQILAIFGAVGTSRLTYLIGNRAVLTIMMLMWIVVCVAAYRVQTANQFYALASLVGLVMGAVQSLSRSTFAKLIPEDTPNNTSYFGFFDVVEKVSVVGGTFIYGLIETLTGSMRNSALFLALLFVIGAILLQRLPKLKDHYQYK